LAPEVDHEGTRFFALILMEERLGCMLTTCNFPLRCCAAPEKGIASDQALGGAGAQSAWIHFFPVKNQVLQF
jgi:hypothetical protein